MEWECFPRDNTLLFHYNILTLYASPVYSYGRPMPLSLYFLPLWFLPPERLNLGLRPLHDITDLFYSVITYTLFTLEVSTFYVILSLFLSFLISHCFPIKLKLIFHYHPYFTYRIFNVIRFGPDEALMFFVLYTHRRGAEAARGAHNSEVARSKRVSGIIQFAGLQEPTTLSIQQPNLFTGMAQRQRAGLITPRSLDQNQLPVFSICRFTRTYHAVNTATPS